MSHTIRGWLLDLYEDEIDGVRLWFIRENGDRICLKQSFPVTFYVAGSADRLHQCCLQIRNMPGLIKMSRTEKKDVFKPELQCVLEVRTDNPVRQQRIFRAVKKRYPDLTFYNADIALHIHHAARYHTFPLAFCELTIRNATDHTHPDDSAITENEQKTESATGDRTNGIATTGITNAIPDEVIDIHVLNTRWDIAPVLPVLRVLSIEPDRNPAQETPRFLRIEGVGKRPTRIKLADTETVIPTLNRFIEENDPDIIKTRYGDDWLFPTLQALAEERNEPLQFNRDPTRDVRWKKEISYFSYGQVIHRGREAHLYGRCHLDTQNTLMWNDYGLDGTIETARVTTLPLEQAARVSPGSGISAMQMITAIERDVLVPEQKQQVEAIKTGSELIRADRGGLIYQPIIGLHTNVAQLDFTSMYPAIIINRNISPEVPISDGLETVQTELGVVPATLQPLYLKRIEFKHRLMQFADKSTPLAKSYAARASALKWLLVVCFGFLGYKNARFGRIEAHEAVTAGGREVLLRAKEVCESMGFRVLHMFVDALWIEKPGCRTVNDFDDVLDEISRQTGLMISLDGIYRWIVFLPSRSNDNLPVPNRYFGCFQDGSLKIRGLELRRHDSPPWVIQVQQTILDILAKARDVRQIRDLLPKAFRIFVDALDDLEAGNVEKELLVVTIRISRELEAYKAPTAAVRAAKQLLERTGKRTVPGQKVRFIFVKSEIGVYNWDQPIDEFPPEPIDTPKYRDLLARAVSSVLWPFGITQQQLCDFANGTLQYRLDGLW